MRARRGAWALALALGCASPAIPPPAESPVARLRADPEAIARGKGLFVGTCGGYCHGLRPDARDALFLFDCSWKHGGSDEQIFYTITNGVPGTRMPAFGGAIPDEDLWKIIAFLRTAGCPEAARPGG